MRHVPTAWNLLFHVAELKAGETVLIMGAGGNLGTIGIQIAKNVIGARVIAAAGSDERVALGRKLGADHGINYNDRTNILDEVMKITGGKGVDVLYDNIANPEGAAAGVPRHRLSNGRLVTAGAHAGPQRRRSTSRTSTTSASPSRACPATRRPTCRTALPPPREGKVMPQIERVLPLSRAAEAHRLVEKHEAARARSCSTRRWGEGCTG